MEIVPPAMVRAEFAMERNLHIHVKPAGRRGATADPLQVDPGGKGFACFGQGRLSAAAFSDVESDGSDFGRNGFVQGRIRNIATAALVPALRVNPS